MKNSLAKPIIDFLKDHDYKVKSTHHEITFKKSGIDTWLIIGLIILICIPITFFTFEMNKLLVLGVWAFMITISWIQLKNDKSAYVLKIDKNGREVKSGNRSITIKNIKSIDFDSKFIASYTSAFKDTNEEHNISLIVTMDTGIKHILFSFKSDYSDPSVEMNQLKDFISFEVNKMKTLLTS